MKWLIIFLGVLSNTFASLLIKHAATKVTLDISIQNIKNLIFNFY